MNLGHPADHRLNDEALDLWELHDFVEPIDDLLIEAEKRGLYTIPHSSF